MPLSGPVLGAALKAACSTAPAPGEPMEAFRTRLFEAMGTAIVTHIISLGLVNVQVASATALTPGVPGVGVGTIT